MKFAAAGLAALTVVLTLTSAPPLAAASRALSSGQNVDDTQSVSGTVEDSSGGMIGGAIVVLRMAGSELRATTDASGRFRFDHAGTGAGRVTVTYGGFAPVVVSIASPRSDMRIVLGPPAVAESVTVRAPTAAFLRTTSATRTETTLQDVPQSVSVITRELIDDQSMRSVADVVRYVPGVGVAQGEGHRDAPIFRGNTSTSDFLVDGLRDDTQYLRDLYNVDRVEVLKGPNGMIFGRGGAGGVINRVTRQADWMPTREVSVEGGSRGSRRLTADFGNGVSPHVATRVTGMYENSGTYRSHVDIERAGINPTAAFLLGRNTILRAGYEFFRDDRTVDRGIPSFEGRPVESDPSMFIGNPDVNTSRILVHALAATLEHKTGRLTIRNSTRYADYDKYYQNVVPGALNAAQMTVALSAYSSGTNRRNLFNQTDVILPARTGAVQHTLIAGAEAGRQVTDNLRLTGFFATGTPNTSSIAVPLADPVTRLPVEFRTSAREQDNRGVATVAAVYAQDQIAFSPRVQAIVGLRYDRFEMDLLDHRSRGEFTGSDGLLSPRLAMVYKPVTPLSLYASYTRSYLPRAGEQLASLTLSNQALEPENFRNHEVGAKWEAAAGLSLTAAFYRLDHGNVVVRDALDPTLSHLVDAERTQGLELELAGDLTPRWSVHGGYAYQDGEITQSVSATVARGARLAQVPRHTLSLWNRYDVSRVWGIGLGVISRGNSFVATDNTVLLPAFTRVDAATFLTISRRLQAHVNLENVLDERYFWAAHNNNNIAPGSPRAVRVTLTTSF